MGERHERMVETETGFCEWVQPIRQGYRMSCCDCGLVHEMEFRIRKGRAQFRARRHVRATSAMRAWRRKKGEGA